jgi:hypothetical protein
MRLDKGKRNVAGGEEELQSILTSINEPVVVLLVCLGAVGGVVEDNRGNAL